jgi:hypothetical protein
LSSWVLFPRWYTASCCSGAPLSTPVLLDIAAYVGFAYVQYFSSYLIGNKFLAIYNDQPVLYMELIILYSASEATHKYNAIKKHEVFCCCYNKC